MNILETFSIILTLCTSSPEECLVNTNQEEQTTYIAFCLPKEGNEMYPILDIGLLDMNNQDDNMIITVNMNCNPS